MDFHGINVVGSLKVSSGSPSTGYRLTSSDSNGNISFDSPSVPSGKIILFESDTAIVGYSLLTNVDDALLYITKGSASGGVGGSGGSIRTGSTWTHPSHYHPTEDHTLTNTEIPSHYHSYQGSVLESKFLYSGGGGLDGIGIPSTSAANTNPQGGGGPHNHGNTGASSGEENAWRPYGLNYTRQQRS